MNYFTSDIHLDDEETLYWDCRPFKDCKHFNKYLFKLWNKQTTKDDTIYIIGDWLDCEKTGSSTWEKSIHYVKKLKANVVLVMGNNEERIVKFYFDNNFEKFRQYCLSCGYKDVVKNATVYINGVEFYLTHKPKDYKKGVLNLFGHTHRASGLYYPFGFNVDCDLSHFRLLGESDIMKYIEMKEKFWDKDTHLLLRFEK